MPGGRLYYLRRLAGENQFKLILREGLNGAERVLVDPDALTRARGVPHAINYFKPSWDGRTLAYGISAGGSEDASLQLLDIASGERVQVQQPGVNSVLFSNVVGGDPSLILGQLQANGRVFLSNPRGILFGAGSQVDVGGLVATTLRFNGMSATSDGRYALVSSGEGAGEIRAEGSIRASGTVALVAPSVVQAGTITAGRVGLAAASAVEVDLDGDGLIFFNARNDGLDAKLSQLGNVLADAGLFEARAAVRSGFAGSVLNLDGVVQARGMRQEGGRIVIDGGSAGVTRIGGTVLASEATATATMKPL